MKKHTAAFRGLAAVCSLLVMISMTATNLTFEYANAINKALNVSTTKIIPAESGEVQNTAYYDSEYGTDYTNKQAALMLEMDVAAENVRQAEEGTVLLKNENGALPIAKGSGITIFGNASVHSNSRASSVDSIPTQTFSRAMKEAFGAENVNTTLEENVYASLGTTSNTNVVEAPVADVKKYEDTWKNGFNDAAVVVFSRVGGESSDTAMYAADGSHFMGLQQNEKDLMAYLKEQKDAGVFKSVIVVINADQMMELGFVDEYDVDACVLAGTVGAVGFEGTANVLSGKVNPSGHLVDTYAKNSLSAPAVTYAGENTQIWGNVDEVNATCRDITNGGREIDAYVIYAEGIYVGYKYYETRYEDTVLKAGSANSAVGSSTGNAWNYGDEMMYTFGYGLSYTTFNQELKGVNYDAETDTYLVSVEVKNTGSVAGKSVVEVYAQTPYGEYEKENKVEKSAVVLAGFEKTKELAPGESVTVTVPVERYLLASYDNQKAKGYILSAGDYYLEVGSDAHDALNNILAAKGYKESDGMDAAGNASLVYSWKQDKLDTDSYRMSRVTDVEVTNRFDNADLNYYGVDFTNLSRSDWEGTYPEKAMVVNANAAMMKAIDTDWYERSESDPKVEDFTQGADNGLQFIDMRLVDFDDEETWNKFIDQMTVDEMAGLMPDTFGVAGIDRLGIPSQVRSDDNMSSGTMIATGKGAFSWVSEPMTSRTWNKERFSARGRMLGIESAFCGMNEIWYGGGNIHRTPFAGRNQQYYSEDGNFGYIIGWYEAAAMQAEGINYCVKHFVLNDQETNRESLNTFCNEQALREEYLRNCEGAFSKGGALSTMVAFNKVGLTYTAANVGLLTHVLRGEWGFKGHVTTDGFSKSSLYKTHYMEMVTAGLDFVCLDPGETAAAVKAAIADGDGAILQSLRRAAKVNLYIMTRSASVNGLASGSRVVTVVPDWQKALLYADGILAAGAVLFGLLFLICLLSDKKNTKEA